MSSSILDNRSGGVVDIWHNLLWSNYKGVVFARLFTENQSELGGFDLRIVQIAKSDRERSGLPGGESQFHEYPYELLIDGGYEDAGLLLRCHRIVRRALRSRAAIVVLPGYNRFEYWLLLMVCLIRRQRVGVFMDSTKNDQPYGWLRYKLKRLFLRQVDRVFCYGSRSAEYAVSLGASPDIITVRCQAAVFADGFDYREALRRRIGASEGKFRIGYVGRLASEKGVDILIEAFAGLASSTSREALLVIIGGGPDRDKLRFLVSKLGLSEAVLFLGAKTAAELRAVYESLDLLVLPSRREAWGLVVSEALAHGVPAVVSDVCGCVPELIKHGVTGLTFRAGSVGQCAAMLEIGISQLVRRVEVSVACQQTIAPFTPTNAARQILSGLKSLARK